MNPAHMSTSMRNPEQMQSPYRATAWRKLASGRWGSVLRRYDGWPILFTRHGCQAQLTRRAYSYQSVLKFRLR